MKAKVTDRIATAVLYIIATLLILLLILFAGYIIYQGKSKLNLSFLTSEPNSLEAGGGIGPPLFNSIYIVVLSLAITLPIGLSAGIYMAEYAKPTKLTKLIRFSIEALASLPSIVIGLFGFLVFVQKTGWGFNIFSGALAVSILNLPVVTRICEDSIRNVPHSVKEASLAIGATHWQTIIRVLIPCAIPGLVTGLIITSGRVFGEAAALIFTSGVSGYPLDFTNFNPMDSSSPLNPFRPAETLAVFIWKVNSEGTAPDARLVADGASAVLIISVFLFNISSRILGKFLNNKFAGR
ncbi:phosphate ABC transporter permease PstA [Pseudobacteroides cellulosolvens]|uniref:phosphate ABC transporter permease PstA n=1 Tax=Pseudobacteroides cellulosolvens TaxID=35825 RepID=UPI00055E1390|nr:phosphate ABC transporter permease PstA [Pseudobacteroides cellulosolvens]